VKGGQPPPGTADHRRDFLKNVKNHSFWHVLQLGVTRTLGPYYVEYRRYGIVSIWFSTRAWQSFSIHTPQKIKSVQAKRYLRRNGYGCNWCTCRIYILSRRWSLEGNSPSRAPKLLVQLEDGLSDIALLRMCGTKKTNQVQTMKIS